MIRHEMMGKAWETHGDVRSLWSLWSQALAELEAIHGKAYRNYTDDHTKLFLTVQNKARQVIASTWMALNL